MRCPRMDHYGFAVGTLDELDGGPGPGRGLPRGATRGRPLDLSVDDQGVVKIHSIYVRYLLPDDVRAAVLGVHVVMPVRRRPVRPGPPSWVRRPGSAAPSAATGRSPRPGGPTGPRPPAGAPNVVIVVLDDVGLRPARLLRLRHRHAELRPAGRRRPALLELPHHRAVLADPGLPAHRAQPPLGRAWAAITDLATGFPGYDARIPPSAGMLPGDARARTATPPTRSASGTSRPRTRCTSARRARPWPLGRGLRALLRLLRRRDPPVRAGARPRQPPGRAAARRPRTATTSPRTWPTAPSSSSRDLRHVDADQAVPPLPRHRRLPLAPPGAAPSWIERYRGRFDGGWDAWRDATLARQHGAGLLPDDTELSPRPDWVPAWDSLSPTTSGGSTPATWRLRRVPVPRRRRSSAGCSTSSRRRASSTTRSSCVLSDNGASSRGRADRVAQRRPPVEPGRPDRWTRRVERIDEIGGPRIHNNYPWGWTVAGNTPFRRWKREVARGRRRRPADRATGRPASPRAARCGASTCTPSTCCRRSSTPSASSAPARRSTASTRSRSTACSFRSTLRRRPTPPRCAPRSTSRCSAAGRIYHDGWKAVTYVSMIRRRRPRPTTTPGSCTTCVADPSECHDLAAAEPERLATDGRALVGRGRGATRCCRSTRCRSSRPSAAIPCPRPGRATSTGPAPDRSTRPVRST